MNYVQAHNLLLLEHNISTVNLQTIGLAEDKLLLLWPFFQDLLSEYCNDNIYKRGKFALQQTNVANQGILEQVQVTTWFCDNIYNLSLDGTKVKQQQQQQQNS